MAEQAANPPGPALFQTERQNEIMALTLQHGRVEVSEIATRFQVTTETIRRDLSELQDQRLLRRVHGGAVAWETDKFEPLLVVRTDQQHDEKRRMATRAVKELPDAGTIIIDSGSTLARFAEAVPSNANLRVITNSLPIAQTLAEHDAVEVIVIGGKVRKNTMAMVDADAIAALEPIHVDTLFIGVHGMSERAGFTTPNILESDTNRAFIQASGRKIVLADHSKWGVTGLSSFADLSDADVLITDDKLSASAAAVLSSQIPDVRQVSGT